MSARTLSVAAALSTLAPIVAASSDSLYGLRPQQGCCVVMERMVNGAVIDSWSSSLLTPAARAMTVAGDRLVGVNQVPNPDQLVAYHPANASSAVVGTTGLNNSFVNLGLERHPISGVYYYTDGLTLDTLDVSAGVTAPVAPITGFVTSGAVLYTFAIGPSGVAIAVGNGRSSIGQPIYFYQLDLATGVLTWTADITIPGALGSFQDLAISSSGELWGAFEASSATYAQYAGLYKLDLATSTATLVRQVYPSYLGLAFLPDTQQSNYCAAKTNSLGCAPTISGDGFPSPTASSGYTIRGSNVRNQTSGALVFGVSGPAATPFAGGTFCVAPPWRRTTVLNSQGSPVATPDCSGAWQLDFNSWMSQHVALPAGVAIQAQWLGRDSGFTPPNNWTLSTRSSSSFGRSL